jgi:hypothetical protein
MGSAMNIAGNYFEYNTSNSPKEADCQAILMDWKIIGEDIRKSVLLCNESCPEKVKEIA